MQITKALLTGAVIFCRISVAAAQTPENTDSLNAVKQALFYGDSLMKCHFHQEWAPYMALYNPNAIHYYGGKEKFKEHVVIHYFRNEPKVLEKPEKLRILNMQNDVEKWQCVIEKVRNTWIDDRKATITSYLVGCSADNGITWKFVDVSHNTLSNLGNIIPEIFSNTTIPLGKTIYVDDAMVDKNK